MSKLFKFIMYFFSNDESPGIVAIKLSGSWFPICKSLRRCSGLSALPIFDWSVVFNLDKVNPFCLFNHFRFVKIN